MSSRSGCLLLLVVFSSYVAISVYPYRGWTFGLAFAVLAFLSVFLRVGWIVPFTIAGAYFGMFILDPKIKGGTAESQMDETVTCIVTGTIGGLILGAFFDMFGANNRSRPDQRPPDANS